MSGEIPRFLTRSVTEALLEAVAVAAPLEIYVEGVEQGRMDTSEMFRVLTLDALETSICGTP
jgi:hypothetical protein